MLRNVQGSTLHSLCNCLSVCFLFLTMGEEHSTLLSLHQEEKGKGVAWRVGPCGKPRPKRVTHVRRHILRLGSELAELSIYYPEHDKGVAGHRRIRSIGA
jgi:hypothetical protein